MEFIWNGVWIVIINCAVVQHITSINIYYPNKTLVRTEKYCFEFHNENKLRTTRFSNFTIFLQMDSGCLICLGSHDSNDCVERLPQHCRECHVFIRHASDHAQLCENKSWVHNMYHDLYVQMLKERCIISFNSPFRFLHDGTWRKGIEDLEMFSPATGAFFRFKTDSDLSLYTTRYEPIRIIVVVKEQDGTFREKLLLLTSRRRLMVAKQLNGLFDRAKAKNTFENNTTLILVISAQDNPRFTVNVLLPNNTIRQYEVQYSNATEKFDIPEGLDITFLLNVLNTTDMFTRQTNMNEPSVIHQKHDLQVAVRTHTLESIPQNRVLNVEEPNIGTDCVVCYGAHHSKACQQRKKSNCFECHGLAQTIDEHAESCSVKNWFISEPIGAYIKIPAVRCAIEFKSAFYILFGGKLQRPTNGMNLISFMADVQFKFASDSKVILCTTGFTRLRVPIFIANGNDDSTTGYTEKMVLMTSHDRTIIGVNGSRFVKPMIVPDDNKHNTPLIFVIPSDYNTNISVQVHSSGRNIENFDIAFDSAKKKFQLPEELKATSRSFTPKMFDAVLPKKQRGKY